MEPKKPIPARLHAKVVTVDDPDWGHLNEMKRLPPAYEQCGGCQAFVDFDALPDENVKMVGNGRLEFWGAPCEEMVVAGFTCPGCGAYNEI